MFRYDLIYEINGHWVDIFLDFSSYLDLLENKSLYEKRLPPKYIVILSVLTIIFPSREFGQSVAYNHL